MDNQVAESTYFKGLARSCKLHEMIVGLRKLEMEGGLIIHFLLISGKQMTEQRTDRLSHREFASRIIQGDSFLGYLPFNKTVLSCQLSLKRTVLTWLPNTWDWRFMLTEMEFNDVYKDPVGQWIWTPPPYLTKTTVDKLCKTKHIMLGTSYVFI